MGVLLFRSVVIPLFLAALVFTGGTSMAEERDPHVGISLSLSLERQRAYPGEVIPVEVTLRVKGNSVRNIGYPQFGDSARGKVIFAAPLLGSAENDPDTTLYQFKGAFTPDRPGILQIGPATVGCEVIERSTGASAFFGAVVPRKVLLSSRPARITIMPIPVVGRPASFSGAIGRFQMNVTVKPLKAAVGEPVTVMTTITGAGTLSTEHCPQLTSSTIRSYPVRPSLKNGNLCCEQVIIPSAAGPLPNLSWSYFDPRDHRFATLTAPLPAAAPTKNIPSPAVPKVSPPPKASDPRYFAVILSSTGLILLAGAVIVLIRRRKEYTELPVSTTNISILLREAEMAHEEGSVEKFYTIVVRILQEIVAGKNRIPPQGIVGITIEGAGSEVNIYKEMEELFQRCHQVRYGRVLPLDEVVSHDLHLLKSILATFKSD